MGEDIRLIGITDISTLADYFLICTATSSTHVKTLCDAVEEAMDAAGASSKMRAIITNAIGMTGENQMYTTKAFRNGTAARAILNDSMVEKARADREAFLALTAEGMPHEEAAAQFVTDENFEAWYEETRTALEMCIAG